MWNKSKEIWGGNPTLSQDLDYTIDRMADLEKYTDYKFSTTDKAKAFLKQTDQVIMDKVDQITTIGTIIPIIILGAIVYRIVK